MHGATCQIDGTTGQEPALHEHVRLTPEQLDDRQTIFGQHLSWTALDGAVRVTGVRSTLQPEDNRAPSPAICAAVTEPLLPAAATDYSPARAENVIASAGAEVSASAGRGHDFSPATISDVHLAAVSAMASARAVGAEMPGE